MAAGREIFQCLLASTVKLSGDLLSGGDRSPALIKRLAQFKNGRPCSLVKAVQKDHCVAEVTLMEGA